jgi:cell division protein FtsL
VPEARNSEQRKNCEMKKYIYVIVVFLLLIFGRVFFVSNQVSLGESVFDTEKMIDQEKIENSELEKEIAIRSSYNDNEISKDAKIEVTNNEVALQR